MPIIMNEPDTENIGIEKIIESDYNANVQTTIADYFSNKNIFVTGGTGFLGAVLIEALLSTTPNIGNIYVLVRDKNGQNANQRIQKLLSKQIFDGHSPSVLKKVIPVIGEMTDNNLGFTDDLFNELINNVNIIYHSAATIKFNSQLRTSIKINVVGTLRTIEFAKKLRNLSSYIYFSTAFCNCNNRGLIKEKVYPSHVDPYDMMKLALSDAVLPDIDDPELATFIKDHPNTYTFTKQLAENLILKEMTGYPAGIVRPSVVYGTYKFPVEGWVGTASSGHLGFLTGYIKGIFRSMSGNHSSVLDLIPCDYVTNSSLVLGWYVGTQKLEQPEVIHCTSGERNPLKVAQFCNTLNKASRNHPSDKMVWIPNVKLRNSFRFTFFYWLFHFIPALLFYIPEKVFNLGKRQHSALTYMRVYQKGSKAFEYFLNIDFQYSLQNSLRILSMLNPKDADRYNYDAKTCDWQLFIERCFKGIRFYLFKESKETTAKHHYTYKILEIVNILAYMLMFLFVFYFLHTTMTFTINISLGLATIYLIFFYWL